MAYDISLGITTEVLFRSCTLVFLFFFSSRRRHTRFDCDWSSDVCSSDLIDDASTDRSRALLESYRDPRIRLLFNHTNLGQGATRNRGLATIASEYVAMLDSDDLSFPERLARQVAYLDAHPEVAVVGSQAKLIDVTGRPIGHVSRPT